MFDPLKRFVEAWISEIRLRLRTVDRVSSRQRVEEIFKPNTVKPDREFQRLVESEAFVEPVIVSGEIHAIRDPEMKQFMSKLLMQSLERLSLETACRRR